ncbi:dipeptide ABC transporter ATP-binding protein [Glaciibacter psychrotolerans]|uniref:Peptide/nickel transport system ATP-binding protein n=1 Tax=Glaciibacter psychrotolerans TaxID=670054 RepID=A0A7Z0ECM0_9MICO|nr:ABC transporter ATP-binding protein [Leifsonia psychrotolerans]NYJ18976.1 peptide/nickel transport system ATP-binding protein [Leifsonia psychrotolerans]
MSEQIAASAAPAVRVQNLRVAFPTPAGMTPVVDGVSFEVRPGECLALVGESGSGKSVTARSLLGLAGARARVQADELSIGGESMLRLSDAAWRRHRGRSVGLVLQDALVSLDPLRTVGREVADPLRLHTTLPPAERAAKVVELLERVGLPDPRLRAAARSGELSGGQRQRALIASAIALDPPLLIADEPTTALDVTVQAQILDLLAEITAAGTGLLLISHDLAVVARIADRVAVFHDGRIVETGPTDDVLSAPRHPQTQRMLRAVPVDKPRGSRLSLGTAERTPSRPSTHPLTHPPTLTRPRTGPPATGPSATGPSPDIVLDATGLSKSFRGPDGRHRLAVDGVSFQLHRGETLGLVGESGSGKTTVARLALALSTPDAGTVQVLGQEWTSVTEKKRRGVRRQIGAIYQDALGSFDPRWTVGRLLTDAIQPVSLSESASESASMSMSVPALTAAELLDGVGLPPSFLSRHPLELSGGQRQRVGIARTLAGRPHILMCDEPVSALDVGVQAQVLDLLDELQREFQLSLLFISHDLGVIQHMSDRVAVMQNGRIVEIGATTPVLGDPQHEYTQRLLASVPRLG